MLIKLAFPVGNSLKPPVYISRRERLITCLQVSDSTTTTLQLELISWISLPQTFGNLFTACSITNIIKVFIFLALVRHPVNFLDAAHNEMVRERQVCTLNKDFCHPLKTTTDRISLLLISQRTHYCMLWFYQRNLSDSSCLHQ